MAPLEPGSSRTLEHAGRPSRTSEHRLGPGHELGAKALGPVFCDHTTRPVHSWTRTQLDEIQLDKGPSGPLNSPLHPCAGRNSRPLPAPAAPLSTLPHTRPVLKTPPEGHLLQAVSGQPPTGLAHSGTWRQLLIYKPHLPSWIRSSLGARTRSDASLLPHHGARSLGTKSPQSSPRAPQNATALGKPGHGHLKMMFSKSKGYSMMPVVGTRTRSTSCWVGR